MRTFSLDYSRMADLLKPLGFRKAKGNGKYDLSVNTAEDGNEGLLHWKVGTFGGFTFDCPPWGENYPKLVGMVEPAFKILVDGKVVGVELVLVVINGFLTLNQYVDRFEELCTKRFSVFGDDPHKYPLLKDDGSAMLRKIAIPYFYTVGGNVIKENLGQRLLYDVMAELNATAAANPNLYNEVRRITWDCGKKGYLRGESAGWVYNLNSDVPLEEVSISKELYDKFLMDPAVRALTEVPEGLSDMLSEADGQTTKSEFTARQRSVISHFSSKGTPGVDLIGDPRIPARRMIWIMNALAQYGDYVYNFVGKVYPDWLENSEANGQYLGYRELGEASPFNKDSEDGGTCAGWSDEAFREGLLGGKLVSTPSWFPTGFGIIDADIARGLIAAAVDDEAGLIRRLDTAVSPNAMDGMVVLLDNDLYEEQWLAE